MLLGAIWPLFTFPNSKMPILYRLLKEILNSSKYVPNWLKVIDTDININAQHIQEITKTTSRITQTHSPESYATTLPEQHLNRRITNYHMSILQILWQWSRVISRKFYLWPISRLYRNCSIIKTKYYWAPPWISG